MDKILVCYIRTCDLRAYYVFSAYFVGWGKMQSPAVTSDCEDTISQPAPLKSILLKIKHFAKALKNSIAILCFKKKKCRHNGEYSYVKR